MTHLDITWLGAIQSENLEGLAFNVDIFFLGSTTSETFKMAISIAWLEWCLNLLGLAPSIRGVLLSGVVFLWLFFSTLWWSYLVQC